MKRSLITLSVFCILISVGCSKKNDEPGTSYCSVIYIAPPTLSFNIVDQSSGEDLFFSESPVYQPADVKVYFKDHTNKTDSVVPMIHTRDNGGKYFAFYIGSVARTDTCMIRIKNLDADRVIYTTDHSSKETCGMPYISSVKINNAAPVKMSPAREVITIKK